MSGRRASRLAILSIVGLVLMGQAVGGTAATAAQPASDVAGAWALDVKTPAGDGAPQMTVTAKGDRLSGHYSSANWGEINFTGSVAGNRITFSFGIISNGTEIPVTFQGIAIDRSSMKGTLTIGSIEGTWTGHRVQSSGSK